MLIGRSPYATACQMFQGTHRREFLDVLESLKSMAVLDYSPVMAVTFAAGSYA